MAPPLRMAVLAVFSSSDALVAVALITGFAAIFGPVVLVLVTSLKRIREASERAAHNTQSNGELGSDPSPYDALMGTHEYMIGQIHGVAEQARAATFAAYQAQAAVKQNDIKTDALAERVEEGFAEAKAERGAIVERIDAKDTAENVFVRGLLTGSLELLGRVDALDGGETRQALLEQIAEERASREPPAEPPPTGKK